jgi:hypothetical protein
LVDAQLLCGSRGLSLAASLWNIHGIFPKPMAP